MKLHIAKDLSLPMEFVTQSTGIIAKRRAGKSYCMRRICEQLLRASQQVVIIDPKGDQWGIRSASDGKSPGYPVIILGGEHGDIPLEVNSGEIVAKLVVEERASVLLDLSTFRKSEVAEFMGGPMPPRAGREGFLEALYRLKAKEIYRTPVCVVIDESDSIAPQRPQKGEERMLGAAEDIVRRGGQRGIGCVFVSQRAAVLNKNVLTQAQILVTLRTIAPQDLEAMKAWIDVHGTPEQQKTLMESLPSLPIGDAWFWSPGWPDIDGIFKRVHVLPIETFDSGATPKPGERRIEPKTVADIDLEVLRRQMAETIQRAEENDPVKLKRRIAELQRELATRKPEPVKPIEKFKKVEIPVLKDGQIKRLENQMAIFSRISENVSSVSKSLINAMLTAKGIAENTVKAYEKEYKKFPSGLHDDRVVAVPFIRRKLQQKEPADSDSQPKAGAMRMLHVLLQFYPNGVTEGQMRAQAGLRRTGTFSTYKSALRSGGWVEQRGNQFFATEKAFSEFGAQTTAPKCTQDVLDIWLPKLKGSCREMLVVLVDNPRRGFNRQELAEKSGIRVTGTFSTYLSTLKTAQLVEVHDGLIYANRETLFL